MKRTILALILFLITVSITSPTALAFSDVTITTTLKNNITIKSSKKSFDVIARKSDKKIQSSVTLNGKKLTANWDDNEKTSYTLEFKKEGANTVIVSAGGLSKKYIINYKRAQKGEIIGQAVFSVELFSLGKGYLIYPEKVNIIEGENSAQALLKLLHKNGYLGYYSGNIDKDLYLAYIADGNKNETDYNGYKSSAIDFKRPNNPKKISISPEIPVYLSKKLEENMDYFEKDDYKNSDGFLGEFLFTNGSGWMYCINNIFPNISFSQSFLSDGDVVRVQFTLGYGADIGGAAAIGGNLSNYYPVANKDKLTALLANTNSYFQSTAAYKNSINALKTLNAPQSDIDTAVKALNKAIADKKTTDTKTTTADKNTPAYTTKSNKTNKNNKTANNTAAVQQITIKESNTSSINKTNKTELKQAAAVKNNKSKLSEQNNDDFEVNFLFYAIIIICGLIVAIAILIYFIKRKGLIKND